jgi:signal transduction histidine kinase/PAS domain-containing protein
MRAEFRRVRLFLPSLVLAVAAIWGIVALIAQFYRAQSAADGMKTALSIHTARLLLQQERDGRVLRWLDGGPGYDAAKAAARSDAAIAVLPEPIRAALPSLDRIRHAARGSATGIGDPFENPLDALRGAEIAAVAAGAPPPTALSYRALTGIERRLSDLRWRGVAALHRRSIIKPGDSDDGDLLAGVRTALNELRHSPPLSGPAAAELARDRPVLDSLSAQLERTGPEERTRWRAWMTGMDSLLAHARQADRAYLDTLIRTADADARGALVTLAIGGLGILAALTLAFRGLVGATREMRAARTALADHGRTFELILSQIEDPILLLDADCSVRFASPSASRHLGDDVAGCPIFCRALPHVTGAKCQTIGVEQREIVHPGTGRTYELSCSPPFPRDGSMARVVVLHDVTLRKLTESELDRARIAAENGNAAKSQFLATMSHELRTPLNAIIGYSDALKTGAVPLTESRARDYAGHIHEAGTMLLAIIDDILDLSRIEAGRMRLSVDVCTVADIVAAAMRMTQPAAVGVGVTLAAEGDPALTVAADSQRLTQVVVNLLTNAVKFTPAGGTVSMRSFAEGDTVHIVVRDTGIGIQPENLERVMQPFGQVESPYSRRHGGAGLGLPIARSLVELHGGHLVLDSVPGQGTTVEVVLPAACADRATKPAA